MFYKTKKDKIKQLENILYDVRDVAIDFSRKKSCNREDDGDDYDFVEFVEKRLITACNLFSSIEDEIEGNSEDEE